MKRVALFLATNIAILVVLSVVVQLLGLEPVAMSKVSKGSAAPSSSARLRLATSTCVARARRSSMRSSWKCCASWRRCAPDSPMWPISR